MSNINKLFSEPIKVVNVGLPTFAEDLKRQGVPVVNLDWHPSTVSPKVQMLLDRIKKAQKTK